MDDRDQRPGRPAVVSVVGRSGSGKTTLITRLIPVLKARGVTTGVVKHHHHLSSFDTPGKDTDLIGRAGADVVVGISPVQVAVFRSEEARVDVAAVVRDHLSDLDLVLTEGFKHGPYPKFEVHRQARSDGLICRPDELTALITDKRWDLAVPQFPPDDIDAIVSFIEVRYLRTSRA